MTPRRWLVAALVVLAIALVAGRALAGVYADYLWYDALGAAPLWRTRLVAVLALRVGSGVAAAGYAFANLYAVRQSVVSLVFPRRLGNLEIGEEVPNRYLVGAAVVLSMLFGVLLTISDADWTTLVLARSGRAFGVLDPYIESDLGFFVYWLPFENVLWTWAFFTVVTVSVAVVLLYALTPSLKWQRGGLYASTYVRRHVTVLIGMFLLLLAWGFRLDMYSLLMDGSGVDGAFSYVDYHIGVPGDIILAIATLGVAAIVIFAGFAGHIRLAGISILTILVLALTTREIAPLIAQHSGTDAERAARERPFQAVRAGYTKRAFAVDAVHRADSSIAFRSIRAALLSVPAWDMPALARAIDNGRPPDQALRVTWRWTPAGIASDVLTAPPATAQSRAPWTLRRIAAFAADDRGAPVRLGGERLSSAEETPLDAPLVYPGASAFVVIPDSLKQSAGTSLESGWSRLAAAWSLQALRLLTGDLPQPRPTLLARRDVRDRLDRFVPFFAQGRRVDPLLVGDSLYWAVDLYSTSATYPLGRRMVVGSEERSYLHHAAVAIVQGSTGDVTIVPDSTLDPIAASWVRRIPSIFGSWTALPAGLRNLLGPAVDGVYAQAAMFGPVDAGLPVRIPTLDGADTALTSVDLPVILPGMHVTSLVVPLVDDADRIRGLLIGVGGSAHASLWYRIDPAGPRWSSVIERLRSLDSATAGGRDGAVVHGRIRAIPLSSGVGFIQPSYHWHASAVPSLARIATLADDAVALVAPATLDSTERTVPVETTGAPQSVAALYAAMRDALKRGDWAAFGRAFDALGRAVAPSPNR